MTNETLVLAATGRRKNAIARVRVRPGTGVVQVNKREINEYFKTDTFRSVVVQPFNVTKTMGKYDVQANVNGGGPSGQAGAIRLGISRVLASTDEAMKKVLRGYGFLTRDPRAKERKKYGQKRARKKFQYTKR